MKNFINKQLQLGLVFFFLFSSFRCQNSGETVIPPPPPKDDPLAAFYLTTADQSNLIMPQESNIVNGELGGLSTITLDPTETFQSVDGFGYSLTGGSAILLSRMSAANRATLLNELFGQGENSIGVSYLRISIGASDLDPKVFSYNDLPAGEEDLKMDKFSIKEDKVFLIPILKEILAINPSIKIMGSPWSAPTWMKTNKSSKGGKLKAEFYEAYGLYFVKYIQAMAAEGITIDAVTIQNEPLHDGNNPSMYMTAADQANFVKKGLGPAFEAANIKTKIIVYDHNADRPDYPIEIFNDAEANKYIDGSAFHLYAGDIANIGQVHNAHPDKNLYFTEQWVGAPGSFADDFKWHMREVVVGSLRNWSKTVLEWNLASDPSLSIHTDGGCTQCLGALTIDGDAVTRNPAYYIIGQVSKFVKPNAVRVGSNNIGSLKNVAFQNPSGELVLVVLNDSDQETQFNVVFPEGTINSKLKGGSVGTYVWQGDQSK